MTPRDGPLVAVRAVVRGDVQGVGFREATVRHARDLGLTGWVRNGDDASVQVHAEGAEPQVHALVAMLRTGPPAARVAGIELDPVAVEGHEQFAIRGVAAGLFTVRVSAAQPPRFELHLQVDGAARAWALPRGPSMDPAVKRLAVELAGAELGDDATIWDQGPYEQGGRVAWPQALTRGHAVFVLHGARLRGGFALQRTRPGASPQWLLIKRRDDDARPGSDIVAEPPPG